MIVSEGADDKKVSIGGWLILIAIAVWFMGILGALDLAFEVLKLFVAIPTTTTPLMTAVGVIHSVASILLLVLLMKRKRVFIKLSILYLAIAFIYGIFYAVAIHHPKLSLYADLVYLPTYVISAIYLLRSKRARNTFVR